MPDSIMKDFAEFLKTADIPSKRVSHYIRWVCRALDVFDLAHGELISRKKAEIYLKDLAKAVEDWQLRQAGEAIKLYNFFVRKNTLKTKSNAEIEAGWYEVEQEIIKNIRLRHMSYRTEQAYVGWIKRFKKFVNKEKDLVDGVDLQEFLTHLAVEKKVASSTQNQALNALVFLFRHVIKKEITPYIEAVRAKERRRLPVVFTKEEVIAVFSHLNGVHQLIAKIVYGGGLRLNEALRLRVKDIDEKRQTLTIREGKGGKDRVTILPQKLIPELKKHLEGVKKLYERDRKAGIPGVKLPGALNRKYPNAGKEWGWFWIFPSPKLSVDPEETIIRRHHLNPTGVQRAFKHAVKAAGIMKNASIHSLRHSFATHLIEEGYDIRTVQQLLGHKNVQTTMIYTHVAKKNILGVVSPLDKD